MSKTIMNQAKLRTVVSQNTHLIIKYIMVHHITGTIVVVMFAYIKTLVFIVLHKIKHWYGIMYKKMNGMDEIENAMVQIDDQPSGFSGFNKALISPFHPTAFSADTNEIL